MDLRKPLVVPVYFYTPETLKLKALDLPHEEFSDARLITFYSINNVSPYYANDNKMLACIGSNGMDFLTTKTLAEIEQKIEECR